ncbi:hypothetical protein BD779DRAFT_95881 [Infundibulicybe gibba]|nr:hypothetical protein BD779DRAFT_95881 [Infundibulicybe gibba]
MSSRLKRKLGELGINTASARANESFCLIGTPLPPLEKSKDTGEFVPLWKQEVRDEKGRRRLHGAFTGGFSAGYFNSVGSKEGWTPSNFVSSRGDRAKQKTARPEDFMDEEDLQELKDSRKLVDTTDEMDLTAGTGGASTEDSGADSITRALETTLLPPPTESAGARILKKMGWRVGQGIGPRVTLRQRKLQDLRAAHMGHNYGEIGINEEDEEANKHTFAPRDTPLLIAGRKDNTHGLGYITGMGLNESLGVKGAAQSTGPQIAAGFGLGALNDADEDDMDVYDSQSQSRSRTAYDIADREEDDKIMIGGREARGSKPGQQIPSGGSFRDGRPVLRGFALSETAVSEDRWFPLPEIPMGWTPDPQRVWDSDPNRIRVDASSPMPHNKWKTGISADERGGILGETPLPATPRSVFDYMSQKDRERLQNIASGSIPLPNNGKTDGPPPPAAISIAKTEPHIAQAALRGFQPFTADPAKHARYTIYLESQASPGSADLQPAPGQKTDEFNKEVEDYAKAALIFKPISGAMAGRFTSAAVVDHGPRVHEGLYTPSAEDLAAKEEEERQKKADEVTPKVHAANLGMFGHLTRDTKPWQPARLLCKRFGVKDPNPEPELPSEPPPAASTSGSTPPGHPDLSAVPLSTPVSKRGGLRDLTNVGLGEDDDQGRDTLTYQRPGMDIFKAIFASDDEDSDGADEESNNEAAEETPASIQQPTQPIPDAVEHPTFPVDGSLDLSSFKPTFIPRGRPKKGRDEEASGKEKERKERKERKKKKTLVSFEVEEDTEIPHHSRPKKKRRDKKSTDADDNTMWVEKPPPEAIKAILLSTELEPHKPESNDGAISAPRARKRAIDFM